MADIPLITPVETEVPVNQEGVTLNTDDVEMTLEIGVKNADGNSIPGFRIPVKVSHGVNAAIDTKLSEIAEQVARFKGLIA